MNPTQQAFLDSIQLCLTALEQALANSQEREEETRKQLDELIIGFKWLERIVSEQKNVPTLIPTICKGNWKLDLAKLAGGPKINIL